MTDGKLTSGDRRRELLDEVAIANAKIAALLEEIKSLELPEGDRGCRTALAEEFARSLDAVRKALAALDRS